MLDVANLSLWIKNTQSKYVKILNEISFSIKEGQTFALIGESGSGKSMTALSIMRLLPANAYYAPDSNILLYDQDILNKSEKDMRTVRGRDIAIIFQDPMSSLNPVYTVGAQILEVIKLHQNIKGRHAYVEVLRLLESVKIPNAVQCYNNYPHELSGGMQQRVMIAMALACKPSLLIADEPTTALDVTTQAQILSLLKDIQLKEHMAIMLITHDLAIAAQLADHIAVMQFGKIVEQNETAKFFAAPQHLYSQQLLSSFSAMFKTKAITGIESQPILAIKNLQVFFPIKHGLLRRTIDYKRAVDDVNLDLYYGQTLALVGESGSGKSTVAKAILALLSQARGLVEYAGHNLLELNAKSWHKYRADLQIIFQNPGSALNPRLRIIDSLEEGMLVLNKLTTAQRHAKIDSLLTHVGLLPEHKWRYPHEFSGGERQRICIARALTVDPKIIICDEPTSSLDVSVQTQVLQLLQNLQREKNLTYLFISHDLNVVRFLAQQVAVMYKGKIVEYGKTNDVLNNPQHAYTKSLLAAVPRINY